MLKSVIAVTLIATCSAFNSAPGFGKGPMPTSTARSTICRPGLLRLKGGVSPSEPKLSYFDARGVAETARVMLAAAGTKYEDDRYKVERQEQGPPKAVEFEEAKKTGKLVANMGRLPIMDVGTVQFGQSHSINRYIAKKNNWMGKTDEDAAVIDALYEHVRDIKDAFSKVRFAPGTDEEKKAAMDKHLAEDLPAWCEKLENSIEFYSPGPAGPFSVGTALSLADFAIYSWIDGLATNPSVMALEGPKPWEKHARLVAVHKNVAEMPSVQKWVSERPVTMF